MGAAQQFLPAANFLLSLHTRFFILYSGFFLHSNIRVPQSTAPYTSKEKNRRTDKISGGYYSPGHYSVYGDEEGPTILSWQEDEDEQRDDTDYEPEGYTYHSPGHYSIYGDEDESPAIFSRHATLVGGII